MIFLSPAHQAFYEQIIVMEDAENEPSRKALFYCLGLTKQTRNHVDELYNFHHHIIKESGLRARWQNSDSRKACALAFNLYNGFHGRNGLAMDYTPWRIFDTPLRPYFYQAIDIRYPSINDNNNLKEES